MSTATGPGGDIWFTFSDGALIGSVTPSGALVRSIHLPAGSQPKSITAGPDGNMWFTEAGTNKIGRVTPAGALLPEINLPPLSLPEGITAGPDGNMWFTEALTDKSGRVTTAGNLQPEIALPFRSFPYGITAGPDGNMWFAEAGSDKIGGATTAGALLPETALPAGSLPREVTAGLDGNLYFTEFTGNKIGRVTAAGAPLADINLPTAGSGPYDITAAPDGNLYFTESNGGKIGMVTTGGTVSETRLPAGAAPSGITTGLDGNVYFADIATDKIGRAVTGTFLTAAIAPADVHGTDGANLLTSVATPTFSGKTKGGAWVVVVAAGQDHLKTPAVVGGTLADAITGAWSLTLPMPLADDTYIFAASALDPLGGGPATAALTPSAKPLEIYTTSPVIVGAGYDRGHGLIAFTVRGAKGLDAATLNNTANYVLSGYKSNKGPITILGVTMTTTGTDTRVILQLGNMPKNRPRRILLRVISGGVRDSAGNALDGEFKGSLPTGDGRAGGDFIGWVPLQLKKK
jgi:streptogramin lyase